MTYLLAMQSEVGRYRKVTVDVILCGLLTCFTGACVSILLRQLGPVSILVEWLAWTH